MLVLFSYINVLYIFYLLVPFKCAVAEIFGDNFGSLPFDSSSLLCICCFELTLRSVLPSTPMVEPGSGDPTLLSQSLSCK